MSEKKQGAAVRAVEHLADALRFAEEAQLETELGNESAAKHFAELAVKACEDAKTELREVLK